MDRSPKGPAEWQSWENFRLREYLKSLSREEWQAWCQAEHERREEHRRINSRKFRPHVWSGDGHKYYPIPVLAKARGTSVQAARKWALRRPSLTKWVAVSRGRPHLYCRHEPDARPDRMRGWIEKDGRHYFGMAELARRRGVTAGAAWRWAKARPELCMFVDGRLYARDEGYRAGVPSPSVALEDVEYVTVRELARRRKIRRNGAYAWVARNRERTIEIEGHIYVRAEDVGVRG